MADAKSPWLGGPLPFGSTVSFSSFTLNQSGDQYEVIFRAIEPVTITRLGVRWNSVTSTGTNFKISLQGVDPSTGFPDGTIKASGGAVATIGLPTVGWAWYTLGTPYACARGEALALVVADNGGNFTSSSAAITQGAGWCPISNWAAPYVVNNDNGTRTKVSTLGPPMFGYGSASRAYGYPASASYATNFGLNTTPDEFSLRFMLPAEWGSYYEVAGVRLHAAANTSATIRTQLYAGTAAIQSTSWDGDISGSGGGQRTHMVYFDQANLARLAFGQEYRIGFRPDTTTAHTFYGLTLGAALDADAYIGGQNFYLSTRVDDGAWSDDKTTRPFVDLILADYSVPKRLRRRLGGFT